MQLFRFFRHLVLAALPLAAVPAMAVELSHVIVDQSEKSATVFVSVSTSLPEKDMLALKETVSQRPSARLVTWQEFKASPEKFIRPHILRNDYPDVDVISGLTKLLEKYDGTNFGLTWNGGLAVTRDDFTYAARTFAPFSDRRADPVHPLNHLEPLLRN